MICEFCTTKCDNPECELEPKGGFEVSDGLTKEELQEVMESLWEDMKSLEEKLKIAVEVLEEIRDDNTHDEEMVCNAYTEHRNLAKEVLEEINGN